MSRRRQWDDLPAWVRESIEIQPRSDRKPGLRTCGCQDVDGNWWLCEYHDACNDALTEARVEVPVRWCTVHDDEDYGADSGQCGIAYAAVAFERPEPAPCHLVPLYYDSTEAPR